MKIYYGIIDNKIDVTENCFGRVINDHIIIQLNDLERVKLFGDPVFGTKKSIFILHNDTLTEYDDSVTLIINTIDNTVSTTDFVIPLYSNFKIKIYYGIIDNKIDVTNVCLFKKITNNNIIIPITDLKRLDLFGDPVWGVKKSIFILYNDTLTEYDDSVGLKINTIDNSISIIDCTDIDYNMYQIHSQLKIKYGTFNEELPEQKMAYRYLKGGEKVLEIGGNIGRNSLIIAYILKQHQNDLLNSFVTLECDSKSAYQLKENMELNNFNFNIENSALSKRNLIQKGWDTIVSDELLDGYTRVNTISYDELCTRYNIKFDTLVLDCEGSFYYILMDMPEILNNVNLIIMENDYYEITKKEYVDQILKQNNFYVDYVESGGWGPCFSNFFEVWKKQ
jgi:FkbM family methyltransferase